ncbi:hypothetical protein [Geodermatophilus sp. SYSU D00815]
MIDRRLPLLALATAVVAACGAGAGGPGEPLPYVAEFALGEGPGFVLGPTPGPSVEVLPEPSPAPVPPEPMRSEPVPPTAPGDLPLFEPTVAWVDDGRYLAVVGYGSSSCPSGPHGLDVVGDQAIEVRLGPLFPDRDPCTADLSGHVTVVELPEGITPTRPLTARFGEREVTIPAVG